MRTPSLISHIVHWTQNQLRVVTAVALLSAALGISADRFVGGPIALIAGQVQALFLVAYLALAIVLLLFKPYDQRITAVLEWGPIAVLRIIMFIIISALALFFIGFTVTGMLSNAG